MLHAFSFARMFRGELYLAALLCALGCEGAAAPDAGPSVLTDARWWEGASVEADPFAANRAGRLVCPSSSWNPDGDGIEIHTQTCNYATLTQGANAAVRPGDVVALQLRWQTLASGESATAHVAIAFGQTVVYEEVVAIPAAADVRDVQLASPVALQPGDPIFIHTRNHGYNAWHFGALLRRGASNNQPRRLQ